MALHGNLLSALIWIIIAAVFDFCDGFAARLLKAYSPMGKELDSLSDMVSFGFAPGMVVYWLLGEASTALPFWLFEYVYPLSGVRDPYVFQVCVWLSSILMNGKLPRLSACRFRRMLFFGLRWDILFLPVIHANEGLFVLVTVILAFITSLLLVSEIPMFSLKVKILGVEGNEFAIY